LNKATTNSSKYIRVTPISKKPIQSSQQQQSQKIPTNNYSQLSPNYLNRLDTSGRRMILCRRKASSLNGKEVGYFNQLKGNSGTNNSASQSGNVTPTTSATTYRIKKPILSSSISNSSSSQPPTQPTFGFDTNFCFTTANNLPTVQPHNVVQHQSTPQPSVGGVSKSHRYDPSLKMSLDLSNVHDDVFQQLYQPLFANAVNDPLSRSIRFKQIKQFESISAFNKWFDSVNIDGSVWHLVSRLCFAVKPLELHVYACRSHDRCPSLLAVRYSLYVDEIRVFTGREHNIVNSNSQAADKSVAADHDDDIEVLWPPPDRSRSVNSDGDDVGRSKMANSTDSNEISSTYEPSTSKVQASRIGENLADDAASRTVINASSPPLIPSANDASSRTVINASSPPLIPLPSQAPSALQTESMPETDGLVNIPLPTEANTATSELLPSTSTASTDCLIAHHASSALDPNEITTKEQQIADGNEMTPSETKHQSLSPNGNGSSNEGTTNESPRNIEDNVNHYSGKQPTAEILNDAGNQEKQETAQLSASDDLLSQVLQEVDIPIEFGFDDDVDAVKSIADNNDVDKNSVDIKLNGDNASTSRTSSAPVEILTQPQQECSSTNATTSALEDSNSSSEKVVNNCTKEDEEVEKRVKNILKAYSINESTSVSSILKGYGRVNCNYASNNRRRFWRSMPNRSGIKQNGYVQSSCGNDSDNNDGTNLESINNDSIKNSGVITTSDHDTDLVVNRLSTEHSRKRKQNLSEDSIANESSWDQLDDIQLKRGDLRDGSAQSTINHPAQNSNEMASSSNVVEEEFSESGGIMADQLMDCPDSELIDIPSGDNNSADNQFPAASTSVQHFNTLLSASDDVDETVFPLRFNTGSVSCSLPYFPVTDARMAFVSGQFIAVYATVFNGRKSNALFEASFAEAQKI
uniref:VASt domain-containing protein n=1 Tax=Anisakis simplex TaxID=6269 RepID=A0A0M3KBL1_ANISI